MAVIWCIIPGHMTQTIARVRHKGVKHSRGAKPAFLQSFFLQRVCNVTMQEKTCSGGQVAGCCDKVRYLHTSYNDEDHNFKKAPPVLCNPPTPPTSQSWHQSPARQAHATCVCASHKREDSQLASSPFKSDPHESFKTFWHDVRVCCYWSIVLPRGYFLTSTSLSTSAA
eukprot:6041906-Amphidinium_carterae.1